jgi:hypothetical protein
MSEGPERTIPDTDMKLGKLGTLIKQLTDSNLTTEEITEILQVELAKIVEAERHQPSEANKTAEPAKNP